MILKRIFAGAKIAPAFLIWFYIVLVGGDLLLTYSISPDMKYESNWLVMLLKLKWGSFVTIYLLLVLILLLATTLSLNYVDLYFKNISKLTFDSLFSSVISNWKCLCSLLVLGCFYSHCLNLIFIILNNGIVYIYIYQKLSILKTAAIHYLENKNLIYFFTEILSIAAGYTFAIVKLVIIKKNYSNQ
jgi:hypothetical protein